MRISYDDKTGGLLISFGDPKRYRESKEIVPGVVVDFDENGKALAVELEDAAAIIDPREVQSLLQPRITKGSDLKSFRERLGLTQEQLGDLLDIPRNTIARWEREEMPIAKVRQLELALSAILRPGLDRSFRILFSNEQGQGDLECGFCGRRYPLSYGMELRGAAPSEEPAHIISDHYDPDHDDDTLKIEQCPNWHRWKNCSWELRNSDDGVLISRGTVQVTKRGSIKVEVAFGALRTA